MINNFEAAIAASNCERERQVEMFEALIARHGEERGNIIRFTSTQVFLTLSIQPPKEGADKMVWHLWCDKTIQNLLAHMVVRLDPLCRATKEQQDQWLEEARTCIKSLMASECAVLTALEG